MNSHVVALEGAGEYERIVQRLKVMEMPDWRTRTLFHSTFNRELSLACAARGVLFLDDFTPFLGADGLVGNQFIAAHGGMDHHILENEHTRSVMVSTGQRLAQLVRST
jgi:hypothetical protein